MEPIWLQGSCRFCVSAADLDLDSDDLQTDQFQSGSSCVLSRWLIFSLV